MPRHAARKTRFIAEYPIDLDAKAAAIRAGYAAGSAKTTGWRLLKQPRVAAAIAGNARRKLAQLDVDAERVLGAVAQIAFADFRQLYRPDNTLKDIVELDDDTAAGIEAVELVAGNCRRIAPVDAVRQASGANAARPPLRIAQGETPAVVREHRDVLSLKPLDPGHARFVEEYAIDLNAAAAAERAGHPTAWARRYGSRLLKRRDIAAAVAAVEKQALEAADLSADRVLRETVRIAFADIRRLFRPDGMLKEIAEIDADTAAAVASIGARRGGRVRTLRMCNKLAALMQLGRHLRLWSGS